MAVQGPPAEARSLRVGPTQVVAKNEAIGQSAAIGRGARTSPVRMPPAATAGNLVFRVPQDARGTMVNAARVPPETVLLNPTAMMPHGMTIPPWMRMRCRENLTAPHGVN